MDLAQAHADSEMSHQQTESETNSLIELEAQMASLLSLHSVTSAMTLPTADMPVMNESAKDSYTLPNTNFVSVIKFNGQPIPPPVLSLACRLEMQSYKEAAVKKEQEMLTRRRQKLVDTVQDIVDRYEITKQESRESIPRGDSEAIDINQSINTTLPGLSDTEKGHYDQAIRAIEDKENIETFNPEASISVQEPDSMLQSRIDTNELSPPDKDLQSKPISPPQTNNLLPSITSSSGTSSSEGSALNTTVIAADDGGVHDAELHKADTGEKFCPPFQSTAIGFNNKQTESLEHSLSKDAVIVEKNSLKMADKLRDSFADSESNLSYFGEYRGLPTPISFENSEASGSAQEKSLQNTDNTESKSSEYNPLNYQLLPPEEDKGMSTLSASQTLSGTTSTQLTLDTVGQSCTLPLSLFSSSSNSTLCEVQDPFISYTDMTTPLGEKQGELVRGAPVGQESSNTESGSEQQVVTSSTKNAISVSKTMPQTEEMQGKSDAEGTTSDDEFRSPPKLVRRNSYTLDHPSPALLDAQARNEAPHASDEGSPQVVVDVHPGARRSLELGSIEKDGTVEMEQSRLEDQQKDEGSGNEKKGTPVLTEDNLLRLQLDHFEEMRKQMEQKQREQIEQMLLQQQQEQLALQKEMAALELRFNQQDPSQIYASVFGMQEPAAINGNGQSQDESQNAVLFREKRSSETTNPSLRDSLDENSLPPLLSVPISHTSPAIHNHRSPQLRNVNASNHSHVSETAGDDSRSVPFYLECSHDRSIDLDYMEVEKSALNAWTPASDRLRNHKVYSPRMHAKFERVSAVVKGYLTRRLMRTHKVQGIIKTIRDTVYFVDDFQAETPIKQGRLTPQDVELAGRLLSQLSTARDEFYDTFQTLSAAEKMAIISQDRVLEQEELLKTYEKSPSSSVNSRKTPVERKPLSAATLKALERKNRTKNVKDIALHAMKQSSNKATNQRPIKRPKSTGGSRVLRPIQGNQSPPSPVGAPFSFPFSTLKDQPKPKAVIHRHITGTSKASVKTGKSKTSTNTTSTTATGKKTRGVRRSLYPASSGTTKGPTKGNTRTKGTRNTVLNKK